MKLDLTAEPVYISDEFWYSLNEGYLKPDNFITNKADLKRVMSAIETLKEFESEMIEAGLLEIG